MESITLQLFGQELKKLIGTLSTKEEKNIEAAAQLCAESIEKGGVIQVFGSGHSIGFGLEMRNRIGSLVPVHQIDMSDFVVSGQVTLQDFRNPDDIFERRPHVADKLYNLYDIHPEDVFIIISNSGINGVVIDLAITAKERGHKIIIVTSWQHTSAENSRHPSGKKLYEFGDVVIDNCGPQGDAFLETGKLEKVCSVSSITGVVIAQSICGECIEQLKLKGINPPIYWDPKLPYATEHNQELREKYKGRI